RAALERERVRGMWAEFAAAWPGPRLVDLARLREAYENLCELRAPAAGTQARRIDVNGVPCLQVDPAGQRVILLVHGGGFALGSARGHVGTARALAGAAAAQVLIPDYRLAP